MAAPKASSTARWNLNNIILLILSGSLLLSVSTIRASAAPVQRACSSGSLRTMARIYMASGGYEKAQPFLVKALNLAKQTNASDSEMSACMLDLAYLYKNQGRLTEAEGACRSGLELQEKAYGQSHPYVAYTLRILSEIYRNQARYQESADTLERAITIVRGFSLEDDQELAPFKVDMARLLTAQGDYVKAEAYYKEVIKIIENSYGPDHLYTTRVLCSMAALYVHQQRYAEAKELISRLLPVQERVYGPDHHFLVPAWLVQSSICTAEGDLVNAKMLLEKSLSAVGGLTDSGHVVECDVLSRLGELYILSKEYTKAEDVLQRALEILKSSKVTDTDRMAIALNSLAKIYIIQGKYSKAQILCGRALGILENIFNEYHPNIADVLETQVQLNRKTGNMTDAARLEQRAEEIRVRQKAVYAPVAKAIE
jgi:tetratricopeptide (TPR) repeat protein